MTSRPPALAVRWAYRFLVAVMVAAAAVVVSADEDFYYDSERDPTAGMTTTTAPAPVSPAGPTAATAATAGPSSQQQQPTAPPAWESGNETTLPMPGAPGVESEAAAAAAASRFQPRVTVVSGLPSYHGIQSISNPGEFRLGHDRPAGERERERERDTHKETFLRTRRADAVHSTSYPLCLF
jgi:hypothetical protein